VSGVNEKTVLVTGAAGYIGSWVTRTLLEAGFRIVALDNMTFGGRSLLSVLGHPKLRFVKADIRDARSVVEAAKGVDHIVHLAAIVGEAACDKDPEAAKSINVTGTQNVVGAAVANGVERLVFLSTCSSYGVQDTTVMADESTTLNPVSLYARTKIDGEKVVCDGITGDVSFTIFRPATVHGPSARMRFDLMVNHFAADAYFKRQLSVFGPEMWRPLMWVGDAGKAIRLALLAPSKAVHNQIFNLGQTEGNYRKREIGDALVRFVPDLEVKYEGIDRDLRSYRVDFGKIRRQLGFTLTKSLDEAIGDILRLFEHRVVADPKSPEYHNA
jgi:nucleoside-diphosphate-sugar epimerase